MLRPRTGQGVPWRISARSPRRRSLSGPGSDNRASPDAKARCGRGPARRIRPRTEAQGLPGGSLLSRGVIAASGEPSRSPSLEKAQTLRSPIWTSTMMHARPGSSLKSIRHDVCFYLATLGTLVSAQWPSHEPWKSSGDSTSLSTMQENNIQRIASRTSTARATRADIPNQYFLHVSSHQGCASPPVQGKRDHQYHICDRVQGERSSDRLCCDEGCHRRLYQILG